MEIDEVTTATCDWKGTVTDVVVTVSWQVGRGVLSAGMDELATATCVRKGPATDEGVTLSWEVG